MRARNTLIRMRELESLSIKTSGNLLWGAHKCCESVLRLLSGLVLDTRA